MRGGLRPRVFLAVAIGVLVVVAGTLFYESQVVAPTATLRILVRDGPGDWLHVNVTFGKVDIHAADAANESGWISLHVASGSIDLAAPGNLTDVLALDKVAAEKYTQIRIVVMQAIGVTAAGVRVNLTIPDGGILKTATPFTLPAGGSVTVTLDFDLANSIHDVGGQWSFQPVLGAIEIS
jgi:Domain of unknown function (DUF4382)